MWPLVLAGLMAGLQARQIQQTNKQIQAQQESISATTRMNYAIKKQQEEELKRKTALELSNEGLKRVQERGAMRASQADTGTTGASPLRLLGNSYLQESMTKGSIQDVGSTQQVSLGLELQNQYLTGLSQMTQLESQYTSGAQSLLQIGISGLQGYMLGTTLGGASGTGATTTATKGVVTQPGVAPTSYNPMFNVRSIL